MEAVERTGRGRWRGANQTPPLGTRRCVACTTQAVAFALDLEALAVARSTDVEVRTELLSASLSRESNYGSASFQPVVMQKLRALQLLLHERKTVFFLDTVHAILRIHTVRIHSRATASAPYPAPSVTAPNFATATAVQDVVVLRDFVADYLMLPTQDIYLQSAEQHFGRARSHCTGVMFIRSTNTARELIEATMEELVKCMATSACTDQEALNAVVLAQEAPVGRLDPADYPGGAQYFGVEPTYSDPLFYNESARAQCNEPPILVHNNWLVGRANKILRFRLHGLWSISGEQPEPREWRHTTEVSSVFREVW